MLNIEDFVQYHKMTSESKRTKDVEISEDVSFRDMLLSPQVLAGLTKCGFEKPSPIQLRAIPIGRCGSDLIVQSKSGTGKTLVYCSIIVDRYDPDIKAPQSLIVVPTREIALQVEINLNNIGSSCSGFNVACVIGGRNIADDRKRINKCKAIVGTPGRLLHLIKNKCICLLNIGILILDEADKLVAENFFNDINILLDALNSNRQIIATSATYANGLDKQIVSFMQNPIAVSAGRETPVLIGVKQFMLNVDDFSIPSSVTDSNTYIQAMWRKVSAVNYILSTTTFKQCILFSNSQLRAKSFANYLSQKEWTVELMLGSHNQNTRNSTLQKFRQYQSRILITSDLMARGVDILNVNLVINLDVPNDSSTYLHRIGRCGRFGRRGLAITLIGDAVGAEEFQKLLEIIKLKVDSFPTNLTGDAKFNAWNIEDVSNSKESIELSFVDSKETENDVPEISTNRDSSHKENESNAQEQNNLKLLEVAKLLIDNKPTQSSVEYHVDANLFASFQLNNESSDSSAQCNVKISENLFEEFTQTNFNKINDVDDEHELQKASEAMLNQNACSHSKPVQLCQDIGETDQTIEDVLDKAENISFSYKHQKIHNQMQKFTGSSNKFAMSNDLWTKIYWQQLSDINHYVKHG